MSGFASHLQSGSIRLRVAESPECKEFIVHRSLLAQHLSHLHVSAHERYVDLEGDEDSIGYLLEFVYTGDYKPSLKSGALASHHQDASTAAASSDHEGAQEEQHPMVVAARTSTLGVWGRPAAKHTRYWREQSANAAKTSSQATETGKETGDSAHAEHEAQHAKAASSSDAAASFLVHAKVYLLAERYGASALKGFALQKLKAALKTSELEVRNDHVASLVELIGNVYQLPDTTDERESETRQKLRQVVLAQAVNSLPDLQTNEEFKSLLKEGGDFVEDLLCHLTKARLALQ